MKIIKNVLTMSFLILASLNNLSAEVNPTDWKTEIMNSLSDFKELKLNEVPDKVLVDFILNENGEIIVLSTSHAQLDEWLKSRLNYVKIGLKELNPIIKYTLPIKFEKD